AERHQARDASAVRMLGALLGYPPCCVDAYLALPSQDDAAFVRHWDGRTHHRPAAPPASPLLGFLIGPLALLSHRPCGPGCTASRRLAQRLLDGAEARSPGYATRWTRATSGVWAMDRFDRGWVLSGERAIERSLQFRVEGAHVRTRAALELRGRSIERLLETMVSFVDHRG
ncbi:MAG: hypothetical protein AAF411_31970, partial [Myxococcota bacterium]